MQSLLAPPALFFPFRNRHRQARLFFFPLVSVRLSSRNLASHSILALVPHHFLRLTFTVVRTVPGFEIRAWCSFHVTSRLLIRTVRLPCTGHIRSWTFRIDSNLETRGRRAITAAKTLRRTFHLQLVVVSLRRIQSATSE